MKKQSTDERNLYLEYFKNSNHSTWVYARSLSRVQFCDPMNCSPPGMRFPKQEYGSGLPFPTPRDLPNPGIEKLCLLSPLHWKADFLNFFFF